jgi:hypothetical protein
MGKHDKKRSKEERASRPADPKSNGGAHRASKAHGRPATVDTSLPATRDELILLHAAARRRRAAATLGSPEHRAAVEEIARIEIRIADIERSITSPRG